MKLILATVFLATGVHGSLFMMGGNEMKQHKYLRKLTDEDVTYANPGSVNCHEYFQVINFEDDGSVIVPKGCACKEFAVRVFFTDPAMATKLIANEDVLKVTDKSYSFANTAPYPDKISYSIPSCVNPEDDKVTIGFGDTGKNEDVIPPCIVSLLIFASFPLSWLTGGFGFFFQEDGSEVGQPFKNTPFFFAHNSYDCVYSYVGTKQCYKDNTFEEPCECGVAGCPEGVSLGQSVMKAMYDLNLKDDSGCVDVCAKLKWDGKYPLKLQDLLHDFIPYTQFQFSIQVCMNVLYNSCFSSGSNDLYHVQLHNETNTFYYISFACPWRVIPVGFACLFLHLYLSMMEGLHTRTVFCLT